MRKKTWLTRKTLSRIVLHTVADQTFEGVLYSQDRDGVTLRAAFLVEEGRKTPLAGETWLPRESVLFAQHDE